jgi:hypothetical protein
MVRVCMVNKKPRVKVEALKGAVLGGELALSLAS